MSELCIGVVFWEPGDGFAEDISRVLSGFGHQVGPIAPTAPLRPDLDLIFMWGPLGSPVPIADQLIAMPAAARPRLVLWHTEQIWNPVIPAWVGRPASALRAGIERGMGQRGAALMLPGKRFRYYGDLMWLRRHGLPDVLAVPSSWFAARLAADGFPNVTAYIGAHPEWGADLGLERDIPVLWMGKPGSRRRKRILETVRSDLRRRGVELHVVDGIEAPYVFGAERTQLLNRTRIVINILRQPWDANAMRYYFAAANRAMILTEPTLAHNPFVPGVHIAEAPPGCLADAVMYYLENEAVRGEIAGRAKQLVEEELTMGGQIRRILAEVPARAA